MSTSIGFKGKGTSCSDVLQIRKQKVLANLYSQNNIKTRGDLPVTAINQFRPSLNVYSQITDIPLVSETTGSYIVEDLGAVAFPVSLEFVDPLPAFNVNNPVYPITFGLYTTTKDIGIPIVAQSSGINSDGGTYAIYLYTSSPTNEAYTALLNSIINNTLPQVGMNGLAAWIASGELSWLGDLTQLTDYSQFWFVVVPFMNSPPVTYSITLSN